MNPHSRLKSGLLSASAAVSIGLCLASPAYAQDATPKENEARPTDIVVTAQFREQNLQDTPLAITAVSGELLEARGQTNVSEVAAQSPNVTLKPQGQELGPGIIAFMRGVGQTDPNFALEPGVGIYIDDVYLPTLTGSLLDLMDLDRVEVLRGPQGTLSGRNSLGGSIKLFSKKPQGDDSGSVEVAYGSYNRLDVRGMMDIGLSDTLAIRVSGVSKNQDGYVTRLDYAATHPGSNVPSLVGSDSPELGTLGGRSFVAGKFAIRFQPNSDIDINLSADFTRERNEPGANVIFYANDSALANNDPTRPWLAGTNGQPVPLNCRFVPYGVNSCDTTPAGYDPRYISYANYTDLSVPDSQRPFKPAVETPKSNLDNYGFAGTIDWAISDSMEIKSITSYRRYTANWTYDSDGSPIAASLLNQTQKNRQFSQEIRLNGKVGDTLDYTVGGFYFNTKGIFTGRINLNYADIDFIHGPDPTPATNKAVFANLTWEAMPDLNITAGIRHSKDRKDYTYIRSNVDGSAINAPCAFFIQLGAFLSGNGPPPTLAGPTGVGNAPNCLLFPLSGTSRTFKKNRTDWRIAVDYRFSPELMAYAQVSTGYRSGGVNPRPFFISQAQAFEPETMTAYEVGFKSDLFDRALRVNVSAFYNDYRNIVLTSIVCPPPAGSTDPATPCLKPNNVGSADVKGFEVETVIYPFDGFTIDGSLSYLDFQYTDVDTAATGVQLDDVTPYTPKWKWSIGAQYTVPNVAGGNVVVRVDGAYQSKIYGQAENEETRVVPTAGAGGGPLANVTVTDRIDGYFLGNARVTWMSGDDKWAVGLEVQNVTDKYYFTTILEESVSAGVASRAPGLPRTWAVSVKRKF